MCLRAWVQFPMLLKILFVCKGELLNGYFEPWGPSNEVIESESGSAHEWKPAIAVMVKC